MACKLGETESQGISKTGQMVLVRLLESQIWHLPAGSVDLWICGGRVQKRDNGLCLPFCLGESCPPALTLMLDTLVPPCMPLIPFKVLPWHWSPERLNLSKFVCDSLRGTAWDSASFFHQLYPHWFLHPQVMGTYFSGTGTLSWGPGVNLGLLAPEISLPIFSATHGFETNPFCVSTPSISLNVVSSLIP